MNCNEIRELLPDLAAGMGAGTPEVEKHLASCVTCAAKLQGFQQTMALLDEWQAPEPSPYFDTRLQARLGEEMARPAGWLYWLRRPAWAMSLAAVLVAGAIVVGGRTYTASYTGKIEAINTRPPELSVPVLPGSAMGDLQALERNNELYADFDVLDELQVQDDVTANP
jgi:predicted anti-sigma-YlaC factor YlaD